MDDLLPYQATTDAPGDSPAAQRDHNVKKPFDAARKGELTTFVMNPRIPAYRRRELAEKGEPSASEVAEGADDASNRDGE
jgi:hypothetical protein